MLKIKIKKRTPARFTGIGLILFTLFFTFFAPSQVHGKLFPNIDYVDWNYDQSPQDGWDDRLDTISLDTVDAVVLFKHCLTTEDSIFVAGGIFPNGSISYIGQYVQGIWVENVVLLQLWTMLQDPVYKDSIFRIEWCDSVHLSLDTSCRAVKARQSTTYANTAWGQGYTGSGKTIAILDTGVDDGHAAFTGKFVAGYDATARPRTAGNPDDEDQVGGFHGTHVAGIALGNDPGSEPTYKGVAKDASLVDVKIHKGKGKKGSWADYHAGMDWCIDNRQTHAIDVINLSIGNRASCNGKCSNCMKVDAAVDKGIVVCIAAGNSYGTGWMPSPGAADRAITVGALYDHETVSRNDDTHEAYSNSGPRTTDNDDDSIDEEKPDIVAPGTAIHSALGVHPGQNPPELYHDMNGTSMSCPHVAGVAAILLQANPGLSPDDVKAKLRRHSTDSLQNENPSWDSAWGKGEVDAYRITISAAAADLYIRSWVGDIYSDAGAQPPAGQPTNLHAKVRNNGPNTANNVDVLFFTNRNNVGYSGWTQIGQATVNVPSGDMTEATVTWTPLEGHQCIRARAVYNGDTDLGNNRGQQNFDPQSTGGKATTEFFAEAGTPFTGTQEFRLKIDANDLLAEEGWTALVYPEEAGLFDTLFIDTRDTFNRYFDIDDDCCPRVVKVDIDSPPDALPGDSSRLVLQGWVDTLMVGQQTLVSYVPSCCIGIRGNVDGDAGDQINVADLTYLVDYLFRGGPAPPCSEEGDVDGDSSINVADLTYLVDFLFRGGPAPPPCP